MPETTRDNPENAEPGLSLDRYELLVPIASGGMGRVWAARLRGTRGFSKLVAIKTILASSSEDELFERMLLDEALLASQIQHPNVAQCLDLGEQQGLLYLVMEWVEGEPLDELIKNANAAGGIPLPIALEIVEQACKGLHAAHELRDAAGEPLGLVHRDVSPQNLMVSYSGTIKLVDFGIAKATQRAPAVSGGGEIKGKLSYMSPEQARGETIDRRTDIFALGVILYALTTGRHPFRGATPIETLRRICSNEPVPKPSDIQPGYPPGLERAVMRAIARNPNERWNTVAELMHAMLDGAPAPSGEDALGAFVRKVCSERAQGRRSRIRDALRVADGRLEERSRESTQDADYSSLRGIAVTAAPSSANSTEAVELGELGPRTGRRRGSMLVLSLAGVLVSAAFALRLWPAHETGGGHARQPDAAAISAPPPPAPVVSAPAPVVTAAPPPEAAGEKPSTSPAQKPKPEVRRRASKRASTVAPAAPAETPAVRVDPLDRRK